MRTLLLTALLSLSTAIWAQTRTDLFNPKPNFSAMKALEKGKKALDQHNLKRAERNFKKMLEEPGYDYIAKGYLGIIEEQRSEFAESLTFFQQSIRSFMDYKTHIIERKEDYLKSMEREALSDRQRLNSRATNYTTHTGSRPKSVTGSGSSRFVCVTNPALQESQLNDQVDRVEELRKSLEEDRAMKYPAFLYFKLGNLFMKTNDIPHAKISYLNAMASDPGFKELYPNLAVAFFLENDCKNAAMMVKKAEELGAEVKPDFKADLASKCTSN